MPACESALFLPFHTPCHRGETGWIWTTLASVEVTSEDKDHHVQWDASPGEHVLSCRATDSTGNVQPTDPPWNFQGMGNNLAQEVSVTVR